jgi:predicted enzyme related to lactoylglutathione lyase
VQPLIFKDFRNVLREVENSEPSHSHTHSTESTNVRAGVVLYWHVDDVDAVLKKAVSIGAKQLEAPQDRGHGFITATLVDPFGNILGIMYNPHYLDMLAARKRS